MDRSELIAERDQVINDLVDEMNNAATWETQAMTLRAEMDRQVDIENWWRDTE